MELVGVYVLGTSGIGTILGALSSLSECIFNRVFQNEGEGSCTRFRLTLNVVMGALEKETSQILAGLASQQKSKVDSAYQYIKLALSDLQAWNNEPSTIPEITNWYTVSAPTTSNYFKDAIRRLTKADEWATEAFNDKRNSKPIVRMEALHIRLFCVALLDYEHKKNWFSKWRLVLEPFFEDRQFVKYAISEKGLKSMLLSDKGAKLVSERFIQIIECLERLIWSMVLKDPSLAKDAYEFALYFHFQSTLAKDVKLQPEYSGLLTFLILFDLTKEIELRLCGDRLVISFCEFVAITLASNNRILAIRRDGRLISFDANDPQTQSILINDGRRWLSVGYASDKGKIYGTLEDEQQICVFDASTAQELKDERINLPPKVTRNHQMKVTTSGIIYLREMDSGKGFVSFSDKSSDRKWFELIRGDYKDILQGENPNEIIGMGLGTATTAQSRRGECFFIADVIKKIAKQGKEEIVVETIEEGILLPKQPTGYLVSVDNQTSLRDCKITVACQMEKANHLISLGVNVGEHGNIIGFPVKCVSSFDKYGDWKMAIEMLESDRKLFICNGTCPIKIPAENIERSHQEERPPYVCALHRLHRMLPNSLGAYTSSIMPMPTATNAAAHQCDECHRSSAPIFHKRL